MKCIIPGANVKGKYSIVAIVCVGAESYTIENRQIFGRAVHSLSKIGDELYLEPLEHGLALRTVNSSRSAYACFIFAPSFFLHYDDGSGQISSQDSAEDVIKCKIGMKSCMSIFKSLATLEKSVEKCKIQMDQKEARLIFQLHCRHGILKTYNLAFIECETLQAVFSKEMMPNVLQAQTRLLSDVIVNFQTTQEEVSLIVDPEKACFKNYFDEETDPQKVIHTALSLDPDEFENYQVGIDTEVTFCLKELRAILFFSEATNQMVCLTFETCGKPIVFSIDSDPSFEANFVLATLARKSDSTQQNSQVGSQSVHAPPTTQRKKSTISRVPSRPAAQMNASHQSNHVESRTKAMPTPVSNRQSHPPGGAGALATHRTPANQPDRNISHQPTTSRDTATKYTAPVRTLNSNTNSHNQTRLSRPAAESKAAGSSRNLVDQNATSNDDSGGADEAGSPVIPYMNSSNTSTRQDRTNTNGGTSTIARTFSGLASGSETEDEDDLVPGTPPAKRFKSIFSNLSQSTTSGSQVVLSQVKPTPQVLAEDTDEDD